MSVLAADTAVDRRDLSDRLFKPLRQRRNLAGAVIEDGSHPALECTVFVLAKIEGEHTIRPRNSSLEAISGR